MVVQFVKELPEDLQVLLAMRSAFQVWFENGQYLESLSEDGLRQVGVEWKCTRNAFNYTVVHLFLCILHLQIMV